MGFRSDLTIAVVFLQIGDLENLYFTFREGADVSLKKRQRNPDVENLHTLLNLKVSIFLTQLCGATRCF